MKPGKASCSPISCYKPLAMTKFCSPRPARAALLTLALGLSGCSLFSGSSADSGDNPQTGTQLPPGALYQKGVTEMQSGDYDKAVKDFVNVEETYPYSTWSTHAELLSGYAEYKQMDYDDAITALNRFIQLHPQNDEAAYAYYLKALCYFEQIEDVQRDQTTTYEAISALDDVITRYPDSSYAHDARIKLRLANNRLAGHDMAIARFYEEQHLYTGAISRYQDVVTNFQTTTFAPEAMERLVECYLDIGLPDAAVRTASVLGYNYPGSSWYETAYGKLKAHGLVTAANQAQAGSGAVAAVPTPKSSPWYWPF
jgi:outer membrane protein assembly factor BamD